MRENNQVTENERVAVLTTNPKTIYNNYSLIKNENILEALESYEKHKILGSNPPNAYVMARIKNLYRHLRQDLKRNIKQEAFNNLDRVMKGKSYDEILEAYDNVICDFLADIGLISTAKKRDYDVQDVTAEDDAKGM